MKPTVVPRKMYTELALVYDVVAPRSIILLLNCPTAPNLGFPIKMPSDYGLQMFARSGVKA